MNALTDRLYRYGKHPNSYDALKAIALMLMIIDHIGEIFLPEQTWLRVIGRSAMPLFLFLVGYNQNYRFSYLLLASAIILLAGEYALDAPLFPLNILVTILIVRLILHHFPKTIHSQPWMMLVAAIIWWPLTAPVTDYGSSALLWALCGYYASHPGHSKHAPLFLLLTALFYGLTQLYSFAFNSYHITVMAGLLLGVMALCYRFTIRTLTLPYATLPMIILSRFSLTLYVGHVLLFTAAKKLL